MKARMKIICVLAVGILFGMVMMAIMPPIAAQQNDMASGDDMPVTPETAFADAYATQMQAWSQGVARSGFPEQLAAIQRSYFEALTKAGFSEAQAMQIVASNNLTFTPLQGD